MKHGTITIAITVAAVLSAMPPEIGAQTVSELLESYGEVHRQRLANIDDLLLVQSVMGISSQTYFEKVERNGIAVLEPRSLAAGGTAMTMENGSSEQLWGDPSAYMLEFAESARVDGTEEVNGVSATVIRIDDLEGIDVSGLGQGPNATSAEARSMRVFLDTEGWVIPRIEVIAEAMVETGPEEITAVMDFFDFRDVEGLRYPHRMEVSVSGLEGTMSSEDLAQARAAIAQLEAQLDAMPANQREALEGLINGQMQELLSGLETGSVTIEMEVLELRVNEGPPAP